MRVPGSNLLGIAMKVLSGQPVLYYKDTGRTTSATGRDVTTFADPVEIRNCGVQAVNRSRYEQMGLDYQKNYVNLFVREDVIDLQRDYSGDQMAFNGKRYQLQSETDWFAMDGWTVVLCVEIGNA